MQTLPFLVNSTCFQFRSGWRYSTSLMCVWHRCLVATQLCPSNCRLKANLKNLENVPFVYYSTPLVKCSSTTGQKNRPSACCWHSIPRFESLTLHFTFILLSIFGQKAQRTSDGSKNISPNCRWVVQISLVGWMGRQKMWSVLKEAEAVLRCQIS